MKKKSVKIHVNERCRVSFSIGKFYKDKVLWDVVDMDSFRILLGRPWMFDIDVRQTGGIILTHLGGIIGRFPLLPHK